jgi:hypothetical protein
MKRTRFKALDNLSDLIKPAFERTGFRVFVLGPALKPSQTVRRPRTLASIHDGLIQHARYLRCETRKSLLSAGYSVDFGEAKELQEFWSKNSRAKDPGSAEMLHARKACGAIIIFPSSVGSISELGMFAPFGNIAKKTLAIVHKRYERDKSFFRKALLEIFEQENGKCSFVDYTNHRRCIDDAIKFVDGKYQKHLRDLHLIADAKLQEANYRGTIFAKR